jgi:hypothetical protein
MINIQQSPQRDFRMSEAEQVDRLAADYDLVTTLALRRFEGAEYNYFANELVKYGMAVTKEIKSSWTT